MRTLQRLRLHRLPVMSQNHQTCHGDQRRRATMACVPSTRHWCQTAFTRGRMVAGSHAGLLQNVAMFDAGTRSDGVIWSVDQRLANKTSARRWRRVCIWIPGVAGVHASWPPDRHQLSGGVEAPTPATPPQTARLHFDSIGPADADLSFDPADVAHIVGSTKPKR